MSSEISKPGPKTATPKTGAPRTAGPKRKRGGQPGNTNAIRHGFYSQRFRPVELGDLDSALGNQLTDEIAMLRIWMRRVMEWADGVSNLDEAIAVLSALGNASSKIAGLMRTQKIIGGGDTGILSAVSETIDELLREWGKKQ